MIVDCALAVVVVQDRFEGHISSLDITSKGDNVHLLRDLSALAPLFVLGIDGLLFLLNEFGLFTS